jgi:hypothetical protein
MSSERERETAHTTLYIIYKQRIYIRPPTRTRGGPTSLYPQSTPVLVSWCFAPTPVGYHRVF